MPRFSAATRVSDGFFPFGSGTSSWSNSSSSRPLHSRVRLNAAPSGSSGRAFQRIVAGSRT
ncbi:hypothetical protein [Paractinoplanes hotanensis]|uniref:Uncharacterized protein n=1 Tax=Paractinoplanes hotanensis TaxID=2906497 RepID=A0ABT0XRT0_9ACTN|nr:hypothetical protein [Actinoplanes hotanensis]MCM4076476.1 hypothetical protein [Actinoplanes hotanensis]